MRLEKEDYEEPVCALCGLPGEEEPLRRVPQDRVIQKLRETEDRGDWPACERLLRYWMAEAEAGRDDRGRLMLHNEMMGFYRKQGKREEALEHAEKALDLIARLGMKNTVTAGTTWVNAGTVRVAFGQAEEGLKCFEQARSNYERNLSPDDGRLGGLYNNMALALCACGRYLEADHRFRQALGVMEKQEHGELEMAITWLNVADNLEAQYGPEDSEGMTEECLARAEELLRTGSLPRDGYYAFVCEKCAPVFGHYGWFAAEAEFSGEARRIMEKQSGR